MTPRGGHEPPEEILVIARATSALLGTLKARERGALEVALADYQARLAGDFAQQWRRLQRAARPAPVTLGDLPDELRRKFIGKSGHLLLQIYSRLDLWDRPSQARFVEELRTVDPDVTGQPVVAYESMRLIERTFRLGLAYAFALVAGIAALMIRRVRETVLAMVPLILGTLWTVGVMQLAGLKFNLVNVWALPLIIGSAAEYGVNIVLRSLEVPAQSGGPRLARSTVMGVVFNGLTTMAGFGSLLVAHHRGVWSLGLLLVIGSAMTLTASLVVLPTLVRLADRRRSPAAHRGFEVVRGEPRSGGEPSPSTIEVATVPSSSPLVIPGSNGVSHPRHSAERDDVGSVLEKTIHDRWRESGRTKVSGANEAPWVPGRPR